MDNKSILLDLPATAKLIEKLAEEKVELAQKDQYHLYSEGIFETLAVFPKGTTGAEELVALFGAISNFQSPHSCSMYIYTNEYLYRCSDHFGGRIAGCSWWLSRDTFPESYAREVLDDGRLSMQGPETPVVVLARIKWSDLNYKAEADRNPVFIWYYLSEKEQNDLLAKGLVEWIDQEKGFVKFNCDWTTLTQTLGRDLLEGLNCY